MQMSDLKYITQKNIEESSIEVTNAQEFAEADKYNAHMVKMYKERWKYFYEYSGMILANVIFFILGGKYIAKPGEFTIQASPLGRLWNDMTICWIPLLLTAVIFGYFVVFRKILSWKYGVFASILCSSISLSFIIPLAINIPLMMMIRKKDEKLSKEVGYPMFSKLNIDTRRKKNEPDAQKYQERNNLSDLY